MHFEESKRSKRWIHVVIQTLILVPLVHVTDVAFMVMKDLPPTGPVDMREYAKYGEANGEVHRLFSSAVPRISQAYRRGAAHWDDEARQCLRGHVPAHCIALWSAFVGKAMCHLPLW